MEPDRCPRTILSEVPGRTCSRNSSLTPICTTGLWAEALQHATRLRVQVAECHALDPLFVFATLRLVEPFQDLSRWPLPFPILPLRMRRRWSGLGCIAKPASNGAGMHALSPIKPVRTRLPALARRCLWNRTPRTSPLTSTALRSFSPFIAVTTSSTRHLSANRWSAQTVSAKFSPRNRKPFAPTSTLAGAGMGGAYRARTVAFRSPVARAGSTTGHHLSLQSYRT
ncbi:hypothetical protein MALG_03890 (plasmid) [Marinovum algicola DG 898]|nr:hypothetical protein MALG_03890 [Marinovum algicola DG 898]